MRTAAVVWLAGVTFGSAQEPAFDVASVKVTDCSSIVKGAAVGPPPVSPSGQTLCGQTMTPTELNAGNLSMARLATTLSGIVDRMVDDHTGLSGAYDLMLTFAPETRSAADAVKAKASAIDPTAPSIFAALVEQLGVKLEPRRARRWRSW